MFLTLSIPDLCPLSYFVVFPAHGSISILATQDNCACLFVHTGIGLLLISEKITIVGSTEN